MSKLMYFLIGLNIGLYAPLLINKIILKYQEWKLSKSLTKLNETILKFKQNLQPDTINIDFNKRKYEIAYKNKVEQVKSKISELEKSNVHKQIAEQLAGQIMVQLADTMVEIDRKNGKIDELYTQIDKNV